MVAAAIVGSAVVGAAATGAAAGAASDATAGAAASAAQVQREGLAQSERLSAPYRQFGEGLIPSLQKLLTPGEDATALLRSMPGYQFMQQEGNQATINAATATGMNLSGNTLRSLSEFNQGLADTTYQQQVNNLFSGVGMGQASAAGQAANTQATSANLADIAVGAGENQANIAMGAGASYAGIAGNAIQGITTQNTLNALNSPATGAASAGGYSGTTVGGAPLNYGLPPGP